MSGVRMTALLRITLAFALSALLGLTGQSIAASRGADQAVGQMVLCTGTGPVVVYMDAEGQPTKPPHYCPDYALTLLGALLVDQPPLPPAPERARVAPDRAFASLIAAPLPLKPARAPPVTL